MPYRMPARVGPITRRRREAAKGARSQAARPARSHPGTFELASPKSRDRDRPVREDPRKRLRPCAPAPSREILAGKGAWPPCPSQDQVPFEPKAGTPPALHEDWTLSSNDESQKSRPAPGARGRDAPAVLSPSGNGGICAPTPLPAGEREGPKPKAWEGEGLLYARHALTLPLRGCPSPLQGEGVEPALFPGEGRDPGQRRNWAPAFAGEHSPNTPASRPLRPLRPIPDT